MSLTSVPGEITPAVLKSKLDAGEKIAILDVREPAELAIASLENTIHIPMGQLTIRLSELESFKDTKLVVYCRSGGRSSQCADFLRANGFKDVFNLTGGILAWSETVDPAIQKY